MPQHAQREPRVPRGWMIVGVISWALGSLGVGVLIATYITP